MPGSGPTDSHRGDGSTTKDVVMASGQGPGTLWHSGASCALDGWLARLIALAILLSLCLFAPGARADGNFLWAAAMGGTDWNEGRSITVDGAGNVYTTGRFRNTVDFDPGPDTFYLSSAGASDIFVQKLDADGHFVWARSMGGTGTGRGFGIAVDGAGNVYTTGAFEGTVDFDPGPGAFNLTSAKGDGIFVQKLDANGHFVWARAMGETGTGMGFGIAVDGTGNVYITGVFGGTADFDPGPDTFHLSSVGFQDIFVQKLAADGHFVWARAMGGTRIDGGYAISVDGAGNVYTTGAFMGTADFDPGPGAFELSSAGGFDIFVQKLDANGDFVWARAMGGTISDVGNGIAVDGAGNVYTTGYFRNTADFDPGPGTYYLSSAGDRDIFVQKLDAGGHFVWARSMGGMGPDQGFGIAVDATGNVYSMGYFRNTVDFDPGPGAFNLTSAGFQDIFVQKLDAGGHFLWARSMGGTNSDVGYGIAVDSAGNVYTTGSFMGTADFDPGPGAFNLTSAGGTDIFVLKLGPDVMPPSAISIGPANTGPTNAPSVDFTVTFDKPVQGFDDAADLVLDHTGTTSTGAFITGGPEVYTTTVEGISGDGSFTLAVSTASDVTDLAGNPLASSVTSPPVVIDNTPPTLSALTVSPSALAPGELALIQFTVSEMLLGDPIVQVAGAPAELTPLEVVKSFGHSYAWTAPTNLPVGRITGRPFVPGLGYFNPEPWPYGPQTVQITLTDLAGNTTTHTEPDSLALVSGLPAPWPILAAIALLSAAIFVFRKRPRRPA